MVMDLVFSLRDGIHSEFDAYGMECIFLILWSASLPMPQISYENEESVLSFEHQDMIDVLFRDINESAIEDDTRLLNWLQDKSINGREDIKIESENHWPDYVERIVYIIKGLLSNQKGEVYCKGCARTIPSSEIKKVQNSPFEHNRGIDRKTIKALKEEFGLKGKARFPGGIGGTTFLCDSGHELFSTRDWIS